MYVSSCFFSGVDESFTADYNLCGTSSYVKSKQGYLSLARCRWYLKHNECEYVHRLSKLKPREPPEAERCSHAVEAECATRLKN